MATRKQEFFSLPPTHLSSSLSWPLAFPDHWLLSYILPVSSVRFSPALCPRRLTHVPHSPQKSGFLLGGPVLNHRKRSETGRGVEEERICLLFSLAPFLQGCRELTVSAKLGVPLEMADSVCLWVLGINPCSIWPRQGINLGLTEFPHPTLLNSRVGPLCVKTALGAGGGAGNCSNCPIFHVPFTSCWIFKRYTHFYSHSKPRLKYPFSL